MVSGHNESKIKCCPGTIKSKSHSDKLNSAKTLSPLYVGPIDKTEDWGTASLYWYWFECSVVACHERAR